MKFKAKAIVPLFIALIFIGSIFVVFTQSSSGKSGTAELIIDIGQPNMIDRQEIRTAGSQTALDVLSSYANYVEVESGDIKCIGSYCSTNRSAWVLYVNDIPAAEDAEHYNVQDGDRVMFRYEEIKKSGINQTV